MTFCPALIGRNHKRLNALSQFKTKAIANVKKLINTLDNDTGLCYTDGSANPNPGSSGAGIFITYRNFTYSTYTSLGAGTNNTGELYAIGMACDALTVHSEELLGAKRIIILPDSLYAIGTLSEGWKAKTNLALISAVKNKLQHLTLPFSFLYCPGHCDIQGNEEADTSAGLGTLDSANGLGLTITLRLSYFNNDFCHPINSTGIQHADNMPPD
jgi:ribonuclease HI